MKMNELNTNDMTALTVTLMNLFQNFNEGQSTLEIVCISTGISKDSFLINKMMCFYHQIVANTYFEGKCVESDSGQSELILLCYKELLP